MNKTSCCLTLLAVVASLILTLPGSTARAQQTSAGPSITGNWEGTLDLNTAKLRLVLKVTALDGDKLKATMDSLDQPGGNNLQVDVITFKDGKLHFEMKQLSIAYDGIVSKDGMEIEGTFTQGGSLPLIFRKQGAARARASVQRGKVQFKTCEDPLLTSDLLCGTYDVFEDRDAKSGRKIALNIILLPALSSTPASDPLFYLAGGPGGAATAYAPDKFMPGLRRNRDVVLVDQRGTGKSNPLNCTPVGSREDMRGYFGDVFTPERMRACRQELEKIADLKLYTSTIAVDDLDEVRAALGYSKINIYGGSYGSTAALVYLRRHPEHVRSVAIFGVAPPSAKIPLSFSKGVQDAMTRLFDDCAADAACHKAYPDVAGDFAKMVALFDKGPVEVSAPNVFTHQTQKVTVTRDAFVDSIRQLLYVPDAAAGLPALIHYGAQGNLGPLVGTAFQVIVQIDSRIARGMQFSVICSEDAPFISEEEIKSTSSNSFYGDARVRPTMRACEEWPRAKVPVTFLEPVKSDLPVLLVAGELDPVTPPWLAEQVAKTLIHSRVVKVSNATHNSYDCIENIVANFIDRGTTDGLNVSCVDQVKRPPFLIIGQQ